MLKSLSLTADNLPISGLDYEDINKHSSYGAGFHASGRSAFREMMIHSGTLEWAVTDSVLEAIEHNSEYKEAYEKLKKNDPSLRGRIPGAPGLRAPLPNAEQVLPRYSPEEFEAMGFNVPEAMEFEKDGKLSLPRFSIFSQAYEDQIADAETVGDMRPGIASWAIGLGGGLAYSVVDPINLIPFGTGINMAKNTYRAGKVSKAAVLGQAVKAGAAEGMLGAALSDAIAFPQANKWGADLGWEDALADIAVSGAFGSFFGALGGGLEMRSMYLSEKHLEAVNKVVSDLEKGLPADIESVMAPVLNEAQVRFNSKLNDIDYVAELFDGENNVLRGDQDIFARQLSALEKGEFRESSKFSRSPQGADGPRLVLGESPAVLRAFDGFSWLEMSPDLARRIKLEEEWSGFDLSKLPEAMARPVAIFDMGNGQKKLLIKLKNINNELSAAIVEIKSTMREFSGNKAKVEQDIKKAEAELKKIKVHDKVTEIDDVNFIGKTDYALSSPLRKALDDGKAIYVDSAKLSEISGLSHKLTKAVTEQAIFNKADIAQSDIIKKQLAVEDLGIDLDSPALGVKDIDAEEMSRAIKVEAENLAKRAGDDGGEARKAIELETKLGEIQVEEMIARGELTNEEIKYFREGGGEGDDAVLGRAEGEELVTKAEAQVTATDCALNSWGISNG